LSPCGTLTNYKRDRITDLPTEANANAGLYSGKRTLSPDSKEAVVDVEYDN